MSVLWMLPWCPRDFASSTRGWTLIEKAIYRELLDAQWDMGWLPVDENKLRSIAGAELEHWSSSATTVLEKFPIIDGKRMNLRLEQHRQNALELHKKKVEAGKKGGTAKAVLEHSYSSAVAQPKHQSQSQSQERKKKKEEVAVAPFDPITVKGLDQEAWQLWLEHRAAIKKPIKPHAMQDAAEALAMLGAQQMHEVKRSRVNSWQGLFPEKQNGSTQTNPVAQAQRFPS